MVKTSSKPLSEKELKEESKIVSLEAKDGLNAVNVTPDDTNYDSETYVGLPAEKEEESTGDEPKKDKDGKSYIQQRKSYNMSNVDKNKLMNTHIGDHINYFDNGRQDNGIVTKMDSSFITIVKENGHVSQVHINDTFFVSDILVNKTWNDMDMEERTVQLQEIHAYSPRYLSKTWEQLPRELKTVLKFNRKEFFASSSSGDIDESQGVKVGGNTIKPTQQRTFGHGSKINHYDPNKNKPPNTKTSGVKDILAEAQESANMSNNGKGMSFRNNSKPERNNAAYKQNQALGQSIQGNVEKKVGIAPKNDIRRLSGSFDEHHNFSEDVEKEGEGMSTSSEGAFNATFGKDNLTVNPKKIKKGLPADIGNSWGIKYINKKDEEKV